MRYLTIKNFAKHQHYKDRRPPWIKLHVEVLDDYAFSCLQDASKAHLMLLWVLASKMDNRIPYDLPFLAKKLNTTTPLDVEELVLQGFVELTQDDSWPLASRKQSAMPETETETETETEKNAPPAKPAAIRRTRTPRPAGQPDPFPKPICDAAYERYVARIGAVDYGRLRKALLPVYRSPAAAHPTAEQLEQAIEAFAEAREAVEPSWRNGWTVEKFGGDLHGYVRLGGMPLNDEWGEWTERGIAAGLASA